MAHRLIGREECADTFDADAFRRLYPEGTESMWLKSAINGYCLAGGLELALACDIRIASETAMFSMSEVLRALVPSHGGVQRLPRIILLGIAMEMLLTGGMVDAHEAHRIGLVNKVVPVERLMPTAEAIARKICGNGPLSVRAIKEAALRGMDMPVGHALRLNALYVRINGDTEDSKEGPLAFTEKRPPQYKGR